jgi:hypothetical protein
MPAAHPAASYIQEHSCPDLIGQQAAALLLKRMSLLLRTPMLRPCFHISKAVQATQCCASQIKSCFARMVRESESAIRSGQMSSRKPVPSFMAN